jgi:hypothetical protein
MPDSMGKRARREVNAKKQDAREQRRIARNQRRADREAGVIPRGPELAEPEPEDLPEPEQSP